MRRIVVVIAAVTGLALMPASASAVPAHLHCLTTPGGTHSIARGVTLNAPHESAFHNLHENVHVDVFVAGQNPNTLIAISPTGSC
jgi:hypothetical protein